MSSEDKFTAPTSLSLLGRTQEYLKSLLDQQIPDSELRDSWDGFYERYNRLLRRFVIARGVPASDVEDCLQDVWKEVATRLVDFQHPVKRPGLRAWLYTLVRSRATDIVRLKSKQGIVGVGDETAARLNVDSREPDPADQCDQSWDEAIVHTILEDLKAEVSELNYQVLYRRFISGQSVSEVADALGIKPEQVRYRQHRMLKKLQTRQSFLTGESVEPAN